jgi:hypothetical protein
LEGGDASRDLQRRHAQFVEQLGESEPHQLPHTKMMMRAIAR